MSRRAALVAVVVLATTCARPPAPDDTPTALTEAPTTSTSTATAPAAYAPSIATIDAHVAAVEYEHAIAEWIAAVAYAEALEAAERQEAARREAEAQRQAEPPRPPTHPTRSVAEFLACTRAHESDSAGGYRAVSPSGTYRGAYQFHQTTWNTVAGWVGRPDLIGVPPDQASPADQDALAAELYRRQGNAPWGGRCG